MEYNEMLTLYNQFIKKKNEFESLVVDYLTKKKNYLMKKNLINGN